MGTPYLFFMTPSGFSAGLRSLVGCGWIKVRENMRPSSVDLGPTCMAFTILVSSGWLIEVIKKYSLSTFFKGSSFVTEGHSDI